MSKKKKNQMGHAIIVFQETSPGQLTIRSSGCGFAEEMADAAVDVLRAMLLKSDTLKANGVELTEGSAEK